MPFPQVHNRYWRSRGALRVFIGTGGTGSSAALSTRSGGAAGGVGDVVRSQRCLSRSARCSSSQRRQPRQPHWGQRLHSSSCTGHHAGTQGRSCLHRPPPPLHAVCGGSPVYGPQRQHAHPFARVLPHISRRHSLPPIPCKCNLRQGASSGVSAARRAWQAVRSDVRTRSEPRGSLEYGSPGAGAARPLVGIAPTIISWE